MHRSDSALPFGFLRAANAHDRIVFASGLLLSAVVFATVVFGAQSGGRRYVASATVKLHESAQLVNVQLVRAVPGAEALTALFAEMKYTLEDVRDGAAEVPHVIVTRLPSNFDAIESVGARKILFFKTVLPIVLAENRAIRKDRARLEALGAALGQGRTLAPRETAWLERLAERYDLDRADVAELLRRVDAVPPSLALAQAAVETGWGTSRLAQQGHALFGQKGYRPETGEDYVHLTFDAPTAAVRAYLANLNTHAAYRKFRERRAALRADDRSLDGWYLAGFLKRYSERGRDYVKDVRAVIRANGLGDLDDARLSDDAMKIMLRPT